MRKAADTRGVTLDAVRPETAVDLRSEKLLAAARRRRKLADREQDVQLEISRLTRRASWLRRSAGRLAIGSNGRRKREREANACDLVVQSLTLVMRGEAAPKLPLTGKHHLDRAAGLLVELAAL